MTRAGAVDAWATLAARFDRAHGEGSAARLVAELAAAGHLDPAALRGGHTSLARAVARLRVPAADLGRALGLDPSG